MMLRMNLEFFGGDGGGGGFPNTGGGGRFVDDLDDLLTNPRRLNNAIPQEWYTFLRNRSFNPRPLGQGSKKGIPFENGGGFKVNWGGDRILQFHPGGGHHGSAPYWKISSGAGGTKRFDLLGNPLRQ